MSVFDGTCSSPGCTATYKNHHWGTKKAQTDGWFLQKSGQAWCPNHIPDWVDVWRTK